MCAVCVCDICVLWCVCVVVCVCVCAWVLCPYMVGCANGDQNLAASLGDVCVCVWGGGGGEGGASPAFYIDAKFSI